MIFKLQNPIPETVKDREELTEAIRRWDGIPYYGTDEFTSHSFLDLLKTLAELSPTFKAVMKDLNTYIFGNRIEFVRGIIPGLKSEIEELDFDLQNEYTQWLKEYNIKLRNILKMSRRINYHLEVCGNAYILFRRTVVGGTVRYDIKVIHFKHVMYRKSEDIGQEFVLVSKFLDNKTLLDKHPPKILPVTINGEPLVWHQTAPDVTEAIVHFKKEDQDGESDFYTRSDLIPILTWLYTDFQLGNLNSKVAATELITKILLAFQAPDPSAFIEDDDDDPDQLEELAENGIGVKKRKSGTFEHNMMVLKQLVTNMATHPSNMMDAGAAAGIGGVEYPYSGVAPMPIPLEMNRDTKHQEFQCDKAVGFICTVLGWAPELINVRGVKTNLGGNLLYDMFTIKNESTVRPRAHTVEDFWNDYLLEIRELENAPNTFDGMGLVFPDVIQEMIERFKGSGTQTNIGENPVRDSTVDNVQEDGESNIDESALGSGA